MRFSADINLTLGILMVGIGLVAAILQSWLWTFPMAPDPGGSDPNGVTTAPKFWRMVHRWLGYVFAMIYVVLAIQMVPRIWQFEPEAWSTGVVLHSVLGLGIGALLGTKVWILRRAQKHGKKLPLFGWGMVILSILVVGVVYRPVTNAIQRPSFSDGAMTIAEAEIARKIVLKNCTQCHGLSLVAGPKDDDWMHVLEEMAENAEKRGLPDPSEGQRSLVANYLGNVYGSSVEPDDDPDSSRGRGRGRGGDDD